MAAEPFTLDELAALDRDGCGHWDVWDIARLIATVDTLTAATVALHRQVADLRALLDARAEGAHTDD